MAERVGAEVSQRNRVRAAVSKVEGNGGLDAPELDLQRPMWVSRGRNALLIGGVVDVHFETGPAGVGQQWREEGRWFQIKTVNPYELSNDPNGYSVYGVVLFASEYQQRNVQALRDAVRNERSMIPAHVTVKGPVCDILDLETIKSVVGTVASMTAPFKVRFEGTPGTHRLRNGEILATQPVAKTLELVAVHNRLIDVLSPITTNAYASDATGEYHPHLTIYHEPMRDLAAEGEKLLTTLDLGTGFEAVGLHLMGHVGQPYRGRWDVLEVYPLGG